MESALVCLEGQLLDVKDAKIPVMDRGFIYGDSLYEVMRTYNGQVFHMDRHLERLFKSAEFAKMTLSQKPEHYAREIQKTAEAFWKKPENRDGEMYIRIIVTRGSGRIGMGISAVETPTLFLIICKKFIPPTDEVAKKGIRLIVSERRRNPKQALDPAMKSGNYLNSVLAFLEAEEKNKDDAIIRDFSDHITEGTTYNIFYVRNGIVATSPLDIGILDGITRRDVLKTCESLSIPYRECRFSKERMYEADEIFITSTLKDVFPVTELDGKKFAPGPITMKLRRAYIDWAKEECRKQNRS